MTNHSRAQTIGAFTFLTSLLFLASAGSAGGAGALSLFCLAFSCFAGFALLALTGGKRAPKWPYAVAALCYIFGIIQSIGSIFHYDLGKVSLGFFTETTLVLASLFGAWLNLIFLLAVITAFTTKAGDKRLNPLFSRLTIRGLGVVTLFVSTQLLSATTSSYSVPSCSWTYLIISMGLTLATLACGIGMLSSKKPEGVCFLAGPLFIAALWCQYLGNPFIVEVKMLYATAFAVAGFSIYAALAGLTIGLLGMPWLLSGMASAEATALEASKKPRGTSR